MSDAMVKEFMVRSPYYIDPAAGLREANEIMSECGVRHLPVIDNDKLVGLISERDLRTAIAVDKDVMTIADVMRRDVYAVKASTPLKDVVADMAEMKIGSAVVVNSAFEVIGIFTTTDALRLLSQILEDQAEGEELLLEDEATIWLSSPRSELSFETSV